MCLKKFAKFTGKPLYLSLCEFCEIFKSTFFTEYLWAIASEKSSLVNIIVDNKYVLGDWHQISPLVLSEFKMN